MPVTLTYPGVYVQELLSPVRPIVGVQTSVAAFVGSARRGPANVAVQLSSWSDYERTFGDLDTRVPLSYSVYLFFLNGGSTALVVRTAHDADVVASVTLEPGLKLTASSAGAWGNELQVTVDQENVLDKKTQFNLTITYRDASERYTGLTLTEGDSHYLPRALAGSQLVTPGTPLPDKIPDVSKVEKGKPVPTPLTGGQDAPIAPVEPAAPAAGAPAPAGPPAKGAWDLELGSESAQTGIFALTKADIFNILCLPLHPKVKVSLETLDTAIAFCEKHRAMLIVDPPTAWSGKMPRFEDLTSKAKALNAPSENAAVYYPNLIVHDTAGTEVAVGPSGAIAGVWASTDTARGVWKAPAGTAATIGGISDLDVHLSDAESGILNPIAINALRTLPLVGPVSWGARTSVGADQAPNQWKYIPVRRTALYIEESLRRGTQWVVFEPNDEPLWSSIRLNIGAFMQGLFRQGAFQGSTPAEAYLVKCDKDNNPQSQIDLGIVSILVGFAPLKPAEFVIINIQQQAGQA